MSAISRDQARRVVPEHVVPERVEVIKGCGEECFLCCQSMHCYLAEAGEAEYLRAWDATASAWMSEGRVSDASGAVRRLVEAPGHVRRVHAGGQSWRASVRTALSWVQGW